MTTQNVEERTEQEIQAQRQQLAEAAAQAAAAPAPAPAPAPAMTGPAVAEPTMTLPAEPAVAEPAAAVPTFAQALQEAVSLFTQNVSALKALASGVTQAGDDEAAAQVALTVAQDNETTKIHQRDVGRGRATDSRDSLVKVLQAWIPE